jgi:hypothetical protein
MRVLIKALMVDSEVLPTMACELNQCFDLQQRRHQRPTRTTPSVYDPIIISIYNLIIKTNKTAVGSKNTDAGHPPLLKRRVLHSWAPNWIGQCGRIAASKGAKNNNQRAYGERIACAE